eukprot:CAMPEP_0197042956 /NCGR_PEP_ID=MMETSP1384-20130603/19257_1 /TAXON_ID=29189 /ORGANISM="Ammonia sp." /LENGTH=345 /DNA_ID=CAMNT_0042474165 /DNA_START=25 /DNA_END=1062 /DNA_ORIENTATION=-
MASKRPDHQHEEDLDAISAVLLSTGLREPHRIASTLQGQIWRALRSSDSHQHSVVIKVASKALHGKRLVMKGDTQLAVHEDILKEIYIAKLLSSCPKCPSSIIQYHECFQTKHDLYLVMENGGSPMFDFVANAHRCLDHHTLRNTNWKKVTRAILKQIVEGVAFMHSQNVCAFDISIENMTLAKDLSIAVCNEFTNKEQFEFIHIDKDLQVKLIDFGLAERFEPLRSECVDAKSRFLSNKHCGKRNYQSPGVLNTHKLFDAAANDVWCIGVCLFMLAAGCMPWYVANESDASFRCIMNGQIRPLLKSWNKLALFDDDLIDLLTKIFRPEARRISIVQIQQHVWLR